MKIYKEFTFDCAHMLSNYTGACKNIHGHTYKLQVEVIGEPLTSGDCQGMLIDFKDLKTATHVAILDKVDHAMLFSGNGRMNVVEQELFAVCNKHALKHFQFPDNMRTTAEEMAAYFKQEVFGHLQVIGYRNIEEVKIRLWETPTSCAEV